MLTSEQIANHAVYGAGRVKPSLIPSQFQGLDAVSVDLANDSNVNEKPHLYATWVPLPTSPGVTKIYQSYVRMGYRIATPDDMEQRNDGADGCLIPWDKDLGKFIDGDSVLMVCDRKRALGLKLTDYLRANAPLWNEEQRLEVGLQIPNLQQRFSSADVDRNTKDGFAKSSDEIRMNTIKATKVNKN